MKFINVGYSQIPEKRTLYLEPRYFWQPVTSKTADWTTRNQRKRSAIITQDNLVSGETRVLSPSQIGTKQSSLPCDFESLSADTRAQTLTR